MRRIVFGLLFGAVAVAQAGCQCYDRDKPRLIDRILHRDAEDGPSRSGSSQCDRKVGCDALPVGYAPGPWTIGMTGTPRLVEPDLVGGGSGANPPPNELPLPRMNPQGVPDAPRREANPNEVSRPGGRVLN